MRITKFRKLIFSSCLLLTTLHTFSQVNLSYYPLQSEIAVGTNPAFLLWGDLRLSTNEPIALLRLEPHLDFNVGEVDLFTFYTGIGVSLMPFQEFSNLEVFRGYILDLGLRARPFKLQQAFSINVELNPYVNRYFDSSRLRSGIGLGYTF